MQKEQLESRTVSQSEKSYCLEPANTLMSHTHIDIDPVPEASLSSLLDRRAQEAPDTPFLHYKEQKYSLRDINESVNRLGNYLLAQGVKPGDRVAVMLPNHPDHILTLFALAKLKVVRIPVNIHLKGAALKHVFESLRPVALIADAAYLTSLEDVSVSLPLTIWRSNTGASLAFESYTQFGADSPGIEICPDDILALTPSSGTTGAPKGVLKSDRTLRAGPQAILRLTQPDPGDVFLLWESLHHGAGVAVVISALIGGTTLAMLERFSASRFWEDAKRHGATHIHYLGTVVPMLLKQPPKPSDRAHSVKIAWGGGCPPHLWDDFSERFGVEMREGYGLSEMITFVTVNPDGPKGSVGKPLDYFDIQLLDDQGNPVQDGQSGEIAIKARVPGLTFLGYFENPDAEQSSRRGDWFCTGDLGKRDSNGFYYYAGRKKDMLRRRGINISAWEVERVFAEHPQVEETALVGVPSDIGEDELKLFIRPKSGSRIDPLLLIKWSESRLPYFQVPSYIEFIDAFPKTATQRIQKKELSLDTLQAWSLEKSGYKIGK